MVVYLESQRAACSAGYSECSRASCLVGPRADCSAVYSGLLKAAHLGLPRAVCLARCWVRSRAAYSANSTVPTTAVTWAKY